MNPGQSRSRTPEVIDSAIFSGLNDLLKEQMRLFEVTQMITDTLGFFKMSEEKDVANGLVALPATMHYITDLEAVMSNDTRTYLTEIKDDSWSRRKNSVGFAPTAYYPIARQAEGKLEVLPKVATGVVGVNRVKFFFIRKPAVPKFNYDEAGGGYGFVYKDDGSVQVDWPEIDHNSIMLKAMGYLGIPTANQTAIQAEQLKRQSGA